MKNASFFRRLVATFVLGAATAAFAQTASLKADSTALAAGGGSVALTASVSYDGQPAALGWEIALPTDWTLVSVCPRLHPSRARAAPWSSLTRPPLPAKRSLL